MHTGIFHHRIGKACHFLSLGMCLIINIWLKFKGSDNPNFWSFKMSKNSDFKISLFCSCTDWEECASVLFKLSWRKDRVSLSVSSLTDNISSHDWQILPFIFPQRGYFVGCFFFYLLTMGCSMPFFKLHDKTGSSIETTLWQGFIFCARFPVTDKRGSCDWCSSGGAGGGWRSTTTIYNSQ